MFQIEENYIVAQTEDLYPFRLSQVSENIQKIEVDVDTAVKEYKCINLEEYFNFIFENYGEGDYSVKALTHQKMNINGEDIPTELLLGIEVDLGIRFSQDDFYITNTFNATPYAYFTQIGSGYDLDAWKEMIEENTEYTDKTKETLYEMIEIIPKNVDNEYNRLNIIQQMPIWDRITVFKNDESSN